MQKNTFGDIVHDILSATPIGERLRTNSAIALERIARGGGATKWYFCSDEESLKLVEAQLLPGGVVSFYFDNRISHEKFSELHKNILERILRSSGELLVGILEDNKINIQMEIISGAEELIDTLSTVNYGADIFYGVFPARDNDGIKAVTVTIPDKDGVVRLHPH